MNYPTHLQYTKTHEWVETLPSGNVRVGLTDYAQDSLGDLVFLNLPQPGDALTAGEALGDVESVKAVSDINCPVSGAVVQVHAALLDAPEKLNSDPYGSWLVEVSGAEPGVELLDAAAYEEFCKSEG